GSSGSPTEYTVPPNIPPPASVYPDGAGDRRDRQSPPPTSLLLPRPLRRGNFLLSMGPPPQSGGDRSVAAFSRRRLGLGALVGPVLEHPPLERQAGGGGRREGTAARPHLAQEVQEDAFLGGIEERAAGEHVLRRRPFDGQVEAGRLVHQPIDALAVGDGGDELPAELAVDLLQAHAVPPALQEEASLEVDESLPRRPLQA